MNSVSYKRKAAASFLKTLLLTMAAALIVCAIPLKAGAESDEIDKEQIDAFMYESMTKLQIPGASLAIVKGDQVLYQNGYGISGPGRTPVTAQTPFVIGSVSKSFTALAVMQLADAGKIDLEAPVRQYLPWFRVADEAASAQIRIKHLLHQTSGLSTYDGQVSLTQGGLPIGQHLRNLKRVKLTEPVGTAYQYSNLNYDILGGIIEAVSGMSYGDYIQQNIYAPLNMTHSYASPNSAQDLAAGYQPVFGLMLPTKMINHEGTVPSGYLVSSAEDMSKYLIAQINQGRFGKTSVVSERSAAIMHAPAVQMWGSQYYGMGWSIDKDRNWVYHDGSTENTYSKMIIDGDYGIILLVNSMDFFHIDAYDQITAGIDRILHGKQPDTAGMDTYKKDFLLVAAIALAVLLYLAGSIRGLFRWRTHFKPTKLRIAIQVLSITFIHALIPLVILFVLPKVLVPWPVIFVFLVGLGHFMYYAPLALLAVGVIKLLLLACSIRKQKNGRNPAV
ncbi:serine hydrolase domain-containing protein [Paenibacillus macerans]|uniref:serine hydrolase domain-containing protein n=1 Tax=Paenibacillus macerans TaxID=44252 RepID=UPI002E1D4C0A|nr:serine hydrolase [Paenibacillus macerans]